MSVKKSALITYVLGLFAVLLIGTGCGDNYLDEDMLPDPGSSSKEITRFTVNGQDATISGTSIAMTLPFGTDVTNLTPTIVHTGAALLPASGVPRDFTNPVLYTVTAEDGTMQNYTATITTAASSSKDITRFTLLGVDGTINGTSITLMMPFGTSLLSMAPTIVHTGVSISPNSGVVQNFTSPVQYTVTAADNTTKTYTVTVGVALSSSKDITQFSIMGVNGVITGTSISLMLPFGTSLASLTPTITHTGASIAPASGAAQNFTAPVMYTVTAADGSTKVYTVTVGVALNSSKDITRFTILGVDGTISGTNISLQVPFGTSLTSLIPTIVHTGASVSPASGAMQSFVGPVQYTVTAADGSTKTYTVNVTVALNSAKDITSFEILGIAGTINGTNISLTLPAGTSLASQTPTIAHTGASISPLSGVAQDFTNPVQYTVTAQDGSTKVYTATVTVAPSTSKDITSFVINGVSGTIIGNAIALTLPFGTDRSNLTPTITHTGASIAPASGVAQNFTSSVQYTVTAQDGSTKTYTVTVTNALDSSKDITRYTILGIDGVITGTNISLQVPFGTSLASLTPTITITGVSVSPASGIAQNYTGPVMHTVTAMDGSTKTYTVNVTVAQNSSKDITSFIIGGIAGQIVGTNITVLLPNGTNVTSLFPLITHTGVSVNPASQTSQNFTNPVMYTVTAADGSTKTYTASVVIAPPSTKDITSFQILGILGTIGANTITLTVPFGTDTSSLTPVVAHNGVNIIPSSGVAQNFTTPRIYTVFGADGSTKSYTVTVSVAPSSSKDITAFEINGINGTIGSNTITLTLPFGTNPASLTPTITHTGASISPASGAAQNFTNPVPYTVTAADGSQKQYTVTVTIAQNTAKDITQFTINGVDGTIGTNTIALTLPFGTDPSALAPSTITHTGTSVSPGVNATQDFTNPVVYTVTAQDGSQKQYTVTVTVALNDAKDITQFVMAGITGTIGANTITLTVPFGTDRTSLAPTQITITGDSVSPGVGDARDFTNPQTYTVTAADGTQKQYTVTVTVALNTAKDITDFEINGIDGVIGSNTIVLTVPFGTDRSSLTPTIVHTGDSIAPNSGVAQNFTNPVAYTVTAADGSQKVYTVTVNVALNTAKDITDFEILGIDGTIGANTITLTVPFGTDRSSLTPTITHTGDSINPGSGAPQNFTNPVQYTVTATDGSQKVYTVTVTAALDSAKDITSFEILGIAGTIGATTITLTVPFGTDRSNLTPTITHTGNSINPGSGIAQDFTGPVLYTVTADDGSTKDYTVTVTVALNSAKDITDFEILGIDGTIGTNTITLTVPFGTDRSNLTPTIVHTGDSISPNSGVAQDFTNPFDYTVTAADGTQKLYTVTVTVALNGAKDITSFEILGIAGTIGTNTITLTVPFGTDRSNLTPTITHEGNSISPDSGVPNDFTNPTTYTVTAANGTQKTYTVTVNVALNNAKDITDFEILGIDGTIVSNSITLTVPFGTDRSSLTPTIIHTGDSISPDSGVPNNFTNPTTYTVTAADGSQKVYTVTVNVALNSAKDITAFEINGVSGTIGPNTITLTMPFGTDRSSLIPTITHTGDSVSPPSGQAQDFTNPVIYTVLAADGSQKNYTVTVSVALNSAKDITDFEINGVDGVISGLNITVTLPFGTSPVALTPAITITGNSVNPGSGVTQNFTNPVMYTVTAADGSQKTYTATVVIAQNTAKDIISFEINGLSATIGANTITLVMPAGTDLTALTPTIGHTGASVSPASGVTQNFTNPVQFTVTAADGSQKVYTATVTRAANSTKDILTFSVNGTLATISGTSITATLPFGTNVTALMPVITHNGASINPASGAAQNFTNPVQYTVTAEDGTTKVFTATITVASGDAKDIIRFVVNGIDGSIDQTAQTITLATTANLTALAPVVTITGVSVAPASGQTVTFSNGPVIYTVTAQNGTTKNYTVTITKTNGNGTKLIKDFIVLGYHATSITNGTNNGTVTVRVPTGTDLTLQTAIVVIEGATVSPPSGQAQNFANGPVTYVVTAPNGGTRTYQVTVIANL